MSTTFTLRFTRLLSLACLFISCLAANTLQAQSDALVGPKKWDKPGVIMTSANGMYEFRYEENGNVSLYMFYKEMNFVTKKEEDRFTILWNTSTKGKDHVLFFENGELKIEQNGKRLWTNGLVTSEQTKMVLTNNGNLLVLNAEGIPLWDTGTYRVN